MSAWSSEKMNKMLGGCCSPLAAAASPREAVHQSSVFSVVGFIIGIGVGGISPIVGVL